MPSKYLKAFKEIAKEHSKAHELIGDCIYVEEMVQGEVKTESGIITNLGEAKGLPGQAANRPKMV